MLSLLVGIAQLAGRGEAADTEKVLGKPAPSSALADPTGSQHGWLT